MCFEIAVLFALDSTTTCSSSALMSSTQTKKPTSEEMSASKKWIMANFGEEASVLPFSFIYGGQCSAGLLKTWKAERDSKELDESRTQHTLKYTDSKTGLELRCVVVEYNDFPTVEWTLYFKNTGASDTPILSDIQALDVDMDFNLSGTDDEFVLHHFAGGFAQPDAYRPYQTVMEPNTNKSFSAAGGRPTNQEMSYFNLDGKEEGVIVVVGWPGQWSAQFNCNEDKVMHIVAGQELTHFTLHPGEEVRTPLIVLQFWKGREGNSSSAKAEDENWIEAQNVWRRWMIKHNLPRPGGKLPAPLLNANSSFQFNEMINANEDNQKLFIDRYLEEGIKLDYWWMDAGWYVNNGSWPNTGTWEVDKKRFPNGLRAIADHAHSRGVKIIVWFEPERVTADTWLSNNHPEWLLGIPGLLDLGNPAAREWLTNHIDKLLTEQGIDLYRQDFNIDPLKFWRGNDAEDRQGITEIRHVTGYLAYWDELRRRHPDRKPKASVSEANMLIDSCASGGRRNDLETLRRSVPLLRSDYRFDSEANQCHTYGMAFWIPFYGTNFRAIDDYVMRSAMCLSFNARIDVRDKDLDYDGLRRLIGEWREVAKYYYGDYYPFTPYSLNEDVWIAWQFHRSDLGEGMVQAFRRKKSVYESARFNLRGLEPEAHYILKNIDAHSSNEMTGRELMEKGLVVSIPDQPGAVIITYKKVKYSS